MVTSCFVTSAAGIQEQKTSHTMTVCYLLSYFIQRSAGRIAGNIIINAVQLYRRLFNEIVSVYRIAPNFVPMKCRIAP